MGVYLDAILFMYFCIKYDSLKMHEPNLTTFFTHFILDWCHQCL